MNTATICHTVLAAVLIITYAVLTATGHDGNTLLGALAGQGLGAAIQLTTGTAGPSAAK